MIQNSGKINNNNFPFHHHQLAILLHELSFYCREVSCNLSLSITYFL
nr:MAG TPA: hypothetical protein [Caudoviricetes sp.]